MKVPKVKATLVKDDERIFQIRDDPSHGYKAAQKIFSFERNENGIRSIVNFVI